MHIVEVCREGDGLAAPMTQMRTWLDASGIENIHRGPDNSAALNR